MHSKQPYVHFQKKLHTKKSIFKNRLIIDKISQPFLKYLGHFFESKIKFRALLSVYRALLSVYRALLSVYRALLSVYRALVSVYTALLSIYIGLF